MNTVPQGIRAAMDCCLAGITLIGVKSSQPSECWQPARHLRAKRAIFSHNTAKNKAPSRDLILQRNLHFQV